MSSAIGHTIAAISIYRSGKRFNQDRTKYSSQSSTKFITQPGWLCLLIACALMPDLDYLIASLASPAHNHLRITHSLIFALALPLISILILQIRQREARNIKSILLLFAGASHLILDLLVGVTPQPIAWPLFTFTIKLPFGLLPSAGSINLQNYYLYRNLLIETAILLPASELLISRINRQYYSKWLNLLMLIIMISALIWSITLSRR